MFLNPNKLGNKFSCNKKVADWLVYKSHLPILSMDRKNKLYYFAITHELKKAIDEMPLWFKFTNGVNKIE